MLDLENAGRRVCFTLHVRAECIEEYKERHRAVWPEMVVALKESGWHNYSLFLDDSGLLIGYLETDDFDAALAAMAETEVNASWQTLMAEFFVQDGNADDNMHPIPLIFDLEHDSTTRKDLQQ